MPKLSNTRAKRPQPRRQQPLSKIEGMKFGLWITITLIYVLFIAILSGVVKAQFPDVTYVGPIPIDMQLAVFTLGISLWLPVSILLKRTFTRRA